MRTETPSFFHTMAPAFAAVECLRRWSPRAAAGRRWRRWIESERSSAAFGTYILPRRERTTSDHDPCPASPDRAIDYPVAASGHGIFIRDSAGKDYIDASGGAAVSCLGHSHPDVLAAMRAQLDTLDYAHTSFFTTQAAEELADDLVAHAPPASATSSLSAAARRRSRRR